MLSLSYRIYDALARRIVPGHTHTQRVYLEWLNSLLTPGLKWLDLGCGHQILPDWVGADEPEMVGRCDHAVGIDLDLPSLKANSVLRDRILGTLEHLPFPANSFDLVTANMVIEHLAEPAAVVSEVSRVMRPGGRFLFHTPNCKAPAMRMAAHTPESLKKTLIWIFEQRKEEDVFPTHYRMNTPADIQAMASQASLKVERMEQINSAAMTAILGPLAIPELLYMRVITSDARFRNLRTNILTVLRK
jgi:ubiquinone/menaquinone biosynthesis C-methylase UbiE